MDDRKRQKVLKQFGKKIREIRESKRMSIRGLADAADIDYSNLNRIENGTTEAGICMIVTIAETLGVSASDLLS